MRDDVGHPAPAELGTEDVPPGEPLLHRVDHRVRRDADGIAAGVAWRAQARRRKML